MATEYTPAVEDIRGVIEWRHRMARDRLTPEAFDRMMRAHDAEVIEKAMAAYDADTSIARWPETMAFFRRYAARIRRGED